MNRWFWRILFWASATLLATTLALTAHSFARADILENGTGQTLTSVSFKLGRVQVVQLWFPASSGIKVSPGWDWSSLRRKPAEDTFASVSYRIWPGHTRDAKQGWETDRVTLLGCDTKISRAAQQSFWSASFPAPYPAVALALLAYLSARKLAQIRAYSRRQNGQCPSCGYDLRATPNRCPECGSPLLPTAAAQQT